MRIKHKLSRLHLRMLYQAQTSLQIRYTSTLLVIISRCFFTNVYMQIISKSCFFHLDWAFIRVDP